MRICVGSKFITPPPCGVPNVHPGRRGWPPPPGANSKALWRSRLSAPGEPVEGRSIVGALHGLGSPHQGPDPSQDGIGQAVPKSSQISPPRDQNERGHYTRHPGLPLKS